jgi:imidazolonepropionase-like amidohydrolase
VARLFVEGSKVGGTGPVLPLLIEAHTRDEIGFALNLADEFKLSFTLIGATEARHRAADLARARVAAVVAPAAVYGPPRPRWRDRSADTPARLAAEGVRVSFGSLPTASAGYGRADGGDPGRFLLMAAAEATGAGLDRGRALRALTIDAAETLGLRARLGSLAAGKDAALVVLTGEPFEAATRVEAVYDSGRRIEP